MTFLFRLMLFVGIGFFASPLQAQIIEVPSGNQNRIQPQISASSISRTASGNGSFEEKYQKIKDLIASDRKLQRQIKASAQKFGIDPIHLVGALVGEHTYNVDALDFLQTYFVKAATYLKSGISFEYNGENVLAFVERPQFQRCESFTDSYTLWDCREEVWKANFAGKAIDGKSWPNDRFSKIFFQPYYAGQTFGLGQLNPLTALRVTDLVSKTTGGKKLRADNAPEVYATIMRPDSTLDYMAAVIKTSIDAYANIAGLDISKNPGLTATLYNLGDVIDRAKAIKQKRSGNPSIWPEENYYGWLINDKLSELQQLVR